jgi:subtilase family protein
MNSGLSLGNGSSTGTRSGDSGDFSITGRELIVVAKSDVELRVRGEGLSSAVGIDVGSLQNLLSSEGVKLSPLFGMTEDRIKKEVSTLASKKGKDLPDLSVYYQVQAPDERLDDLADSLRGQEVVSAAYVKPATSPALWPDDALPLMEEPPLNTPSFVSRQGYLDVAPGGINARYAWRLAGGRGQSVRIIDIEGNWRFSHEDLLQNQGGIVAGIPIENTGWRNHGTAVVGEFGADNNIFGITGICNEANVRAISIQEASNVYSSASAIRRAADLLSRGDIILIELHRPGPRFDFQSPQGQRGYIAIEWWPDDYDAIQYAVSRGIIVVEAAGNGAENLDDNLYNLPDAGFPPSWTNPFNPANSQSNAVIVGAGAPPPGTHGRDHGPDRSRLDFSNYGERVDTQGWGREVTTTGGSHNSPGDLQGGIIEDEWYTDTFSGTSSASPIIVGTLGCIQGILLARRRTVLSSSAARDLLRRTGSVQEDAPGRPRTQRIGTRPNLRQLIPYALRLSTRRTKSSASRTRSLKKIIKRNQNL